MFFRSSIFLMSRFQYVGYFMVYFVTFPFRFFKLKRLLSFRNVLVASFAMPEYELKEMRTFGFHKKKHICTESSSVSPFVLVSSLESPMETKFGGQIGEQLHSH